MKKIIAAAVATAFVAPAFAADVTVSGDVEFVYVNQGGVLSGVNGDRDFKIVGSEEFDGMTVTATLDVEDADMAAGTPDSKLAISGDFGTVEFGAGAGEASAAYEDAADVAEYGAGAELSDGFATETSIDYRGTVMEGLSVAASYGINGAEDKTSVAYGAKYSMSGFSIAYSTIDVDGQDQAPNSLSATGTFGPVYVGVERISNNAGVKDADITSVGVTYSYGPGKVYYEANNNSDATADVVAYGISYKMGPVNTYLGVVDTDGTEDNTTAVGIEYGF